MKYCSTCGAELYDEAVICPNCGCSTSPKVPDKPSKGFAALGFFFPVVGLILFLVYRNETPRKAKSAGKGAIAGVITSVVLSILMFMISFFTMYFLADNSTEAHDFKYYTDGNEIIDEYGFAFDNELPLDSQEVA